MRERRVGLEEPVHYGTDTGIIQLASYERALPHGLLGPAIGTVTTPMSTTGGLYVHDAPGIKGLIYYEKDQQKLREEALEHANRKVPESAVPIIVVPLPVPVPLPG